MLKRRQQILAKIEDSDGVAVTPGASDAVLVYEPETNDDVNFLDRVPAGATLSRENTPPGLTTRTNTFQSDFRGSGAVATAPEWGKFAKACAHREVNLVRLPVTGVSSTERFQVGELVQQGSSAIRGICLTDLKGTDGDVLVAVIAGTFTNGGTLTGESAGASATIGTVDSTDEGWGYLPDSLRLVQWTTGAWSASTPAGVGVVLSILRGGFVMGSLQVVELGTGSSWTTGVKGVLLWGTLANGDVLSDGTNTATLSASPTQVRTPSLTVWNNLDGFLRQTAGARGDFTLEGGNGEPLAFSWTLRGRADLHTAALPTTVSGLSTVRAPRLFGAFVGLGFGTQFYRMPVKSVSLTPGNTVSDRPDANATGGSQGTQITDRDPTITIEIDHVGLGFDLLSMRNSESIVRFGAVLGGNGAGTWAGRTAGNTLAIAAPKCQVTEISDGDADGVATLQVTLKPRRIQDAGDDEYCLAMF